MTPRGSLTHPAGALAEFQLEPSRVWKQIGPVDQLRDSLHADPRWLPFLRRTGKAPEQLAAIKFEVTPPKRILRQPVCPVAIA